MESCRFCDAEYKEGRMVLENELCFANFDSNPVTEGHMKVIPKRHIETFFEMTDEELVAMYDLLKQCKELIEKQHKPGGYNVGVNSGKTAGQTVFHLHIHLIPRYEGDVPDPTGGVRNVIPEKGNYLKK